MTTSKSKSTDNNPFSAALGTATTRRRKTGEAAGAGTDEARRPATGEQRVAVDVPVSQWRRVKMIAVTQDITIKQFVQAAIEAELNRREGS